MTKSGRAKLERNFLSREIILLAGLNLIDREPFSPLTMKRLGDELGVDATAVYRHFRNRDGLILALGDLMIGEALQKISATDGDWVADLRTLAWVYRRTYLARPALAVEVAPRFTGGPNGRAKADYILNSLRSAGLEGAELARQTRAYLEVVFGHIGLTASLISLPVELQSGDVAIGLEIFHTRPTAGTNDFTQLGGAEEDEERVFEAMLETYLAGLRTIVAEKGAPRAADPSASTT